MIGGIVAIGIAILLIWKLFDEIRYHREVAKFEEEKKKAKWDMVGYCVLPYAVLKTCKINIFCNI